MVQNDNFLKCLILAQKGCRSKLFKFPFFKNSRGPKVTEKKFEIYSFKLLEGYFSLNYFLATSPSECLISLLDDVQKKSTNLIYFFKFI